MSSLTQNHHTIPTQVFKVFEEELGKLGYTIEAHNAPVGRIGDTIYRPFSDCIL